MKNTIIVILGLLGLYWLLDHHSPLPLNHDSLGLHEHGIHSIIGIIFLIIAAFFTWKWKSKSNKV